MVLAVAYSVLLIIFLPSYEFAESDMKGIRVCDDFPSYNYPKAKYCRNNPDGDSNITEIIERWGFTAEAHDIFTEDSYKISLFRAYSSIKKKNAVLIGHDLLQSPLAWVNRGKKSLVHFLASQGFDVWIICFRGFMYSRGHKHLTTNDDEYWNFSFSEMGHYDLRSALEFIKRETKQKAIYIGHSMGSTAGFVYSSSDSEDAKDKLKGIISLAPLAYLTHMKSYASFILPLLPILKPLIYATTHGEVFPRTPLRKKFCSYTPFQFFLCDTMLMPLTGDDYSQMDPPDQPLIQSMNYDSVGIGVLLHYNQIQSTNKFDQRDFGIEKNYEKYGQGTPLPFDISKIPVPVTMIVGQNDWISTQADAEFFWNKLPKDSKGEFIMINYKKWNHYDFVRARDIEPLLFNPVLKQLEKMCD